MVYDFNLSTAYIINKNVEESDKNFDNIASK